MIALPFANAQLTLHISNASHRICNANAWSKLPHASLDRCRTQALSDAGVYCIVKYLKHQLRCQITNHVHLTFQFLKFAAMASAARQARFTLTYRTLKFQFGTFSVLASLIYMHSLARTRCSHPLTSQQGTKSDVYGCLARRGGWKHMATAISTSQDK